MTTINESVGYSIYALHSTASLSRKDNQHKKNLIPNLTKLKIINVYHTTATDTSLPGYREVLNKCNNGGVPESLPKV